MAISQKGIVWIDIK